MKKGRKGWTTISIPVSLHRKMKKVYRAHGGKDVFRTMYTFLDVLLDYAVHTDTEVLVEILLAKDRQLNKYPEFRDLLQQLRKDIPLPRSVAEKIQKPTALSTAPAESSESPESVEAETQEDTVREDTVQDTEMPDIPPHQIL